MTKDSIKILRECQSLLNNHLYDVEPSFVREVVADALDKMDKSILILRIYADKQKQLQ